MQQIMSLSGVSFEVHLLLLYTTHVITEHLAINLVRSCPRNA